MHQDAAADCRCVGGGDPAPRCPVPGCTSGQNGGDGQLSCPSLITPHRVAHLLTLHALPSCAVLAPCTLADIADFIQQYWLAFMVGCFVD